MDAARAIGGAIQDKFQWKVKMKGFDIEVVVNIDLSKILKFIYKYVLYDFVFNDDN